MSDTGERDFAKIASIASVAIGFLSLLCSFIPACGAIVILFGLGAAGFGIAKAQSPRERVIGGIGLALCLLGMLLSCGNAYVGVKMRTDPEWNPYGIRGVLEPGGPNQGPLMPVGSDPATPRPLTPPPTPRPPG